MWNSKLKTVFKKDEPLSHKKLKRVPICTKLPVINALTYYTIYYERTVVSRELKMNFLIHKE
jgi:hypothetical protein